MSWTLSASGKLPAELEHLEQEFVDELHALLARFGARFSHFQGPTVDRLTAGDAAPPATAAEAAPTPAPAAEPPAEETPAPAAKTAKAAKDAPPTADPPAQGS